jgi:hypothetical protein
MDKYLNVQFCDRMKTTNMTLPAKRPAYGFYYDFLCQHKGDPAADAIRSQMPTEEAFYVRRHELMLAITIFLERDDLATFYGDYGGKTKVEMRATLVRLKATSMQRGQAQAVLN